MSRKDKKMARLMIGWLLAFLTKPVSLVTWLVLPYL